MASIIKRVLATGLVLALALQAHAKTTTNQFNLPAQLLSESLKAVAAMTDVNVLFDSDEIAAHVAPALNGKVTLDQALTTLLAGSGLRPRYLDEKTVVLEREKMSSVRATKEDQGMLLAQAEDADSTAGSNAANTATAQDSSAKNSTGLQEIVVTATKRAENVQDVPISMAVVTADDIDRRGLVSAEDYLRGIPGVNQTDPGIFGQTIVIRGIETSTLSQNLGAGPTTATYIGETPTTTAAGIGGGSNIDVKLVDIERVEVLRGPQGTAFGSSALGGAIRTIPVAPKLDRFEAKLGAGYSATAREGGNNHNFHGVANLPVIKDKLAIRASAYRYEQSGYYRNVAGSDTALQAQVSPLGGEVFAVNEDEVGASRFTGGRVAALLQASDNLRFTVSYLMQETEIDGLGMAMLGPTRGDYEQTLLQIAPEHTRGDWKGGFNDTDIEIANAVMEFDFSWANLLGTYSYINSGSLHRSSFTVFTIPWPLSGGGASDHRAHVGEIRLTTKLEGPWNFLAGLYAEELKDEFPLDWVWHGDPATNFLDPNGVYDPNRRSVGTRYHQRTLRQKAAFGEASWELMQGLTFTGGVRAYEYNRTGNDANANAFSGNVNVDLGNKASGANLRANLSYKPNEATLLYGGWTQGFRLGQVQQGIPPALCDLNGDGLIDGTNRSLGSTMLLESDALDNYEIGGKFAFLDRRLTVDTAIFRMEWSDVPVGVNLSREAGVAPNCVLVSHHLANAGAARSEGVELQANLQVNEAFHVSVGGSWIDATLQNDIPALGAVAGNRLPGAPEYNANLGLQYQFTIAGQKPSVRVDTTYVGNFYEGLGALAEAGDYVRVDASARLPIGGSNIDLFVRNLTNEDALVGGGGFWLMRLRPRTVGLAVSYD